jgi:endo-1,4-beta-xylanase
MKFLCLSLLISTACLAMGADTLRSAAGERLVIGCAIATPDLADGALATLIPRQFGCITPEYEFMPALLVDDSGRFAFDFTAADRIMAFAEERRLQVLGHMLVWHNVSRAWLFESPDGKPLPRAQALGNLERYIRAITGRYRGRMLAWNVVNEAISDNEGEFLRDTPALRAIGEDYVVQAFRLAHEADPEARLYYNDYNIEEPAKLAKTLRLIGQLKRAGVRLDAVGIQGHWLLGWPSTDAIGAAIRALAATGAEVMITELDIDPLPRIAGGADLAKVERGADPFVGGLPSEVQQQLAQRYAEVVTEILRHPSVRVIGFWGTHDGRSWLNDFPVKGRTNHPLLFDRSLAPKPAFTAVVEALKAAPR